MRNSFDIVGTIFEVKDRGLPVLKAFKIRENKFREKRYIEKVFNIEELAQMGFENSKVSVGFDINYNVIVNLYTKTAFKGVPVYLRKNNEIIEIDNTITLLGNLVNYSGKIVGHVVKIFGCQTEMSEASIINYSPYLNCTNFFVRKNVGGVGYDIVGMHGMKKLELPTKSIKIAEYNKKADGTVVKSNIDLVTILGIIRDNNGNIVYPGEDKYNRITNVEYVDNNNYKDYKVYGSLGSTDLIWNKTKFNVSCRFKVPGQLELRSDIADILGVKSLPVYRWSTKTIVYNGKHNMERLQAVIPINMVNKFISELGNYSTDISVMEITKEDEVKSINLLKGCVNGIKYRLFELRVSQIPVINPNIADSYMLYNKANKVMGRVKDDGTVLYKTVHQMESLSVIAKFCRGKIKELENTGVRVVNIDKPLYEEFEGFSNKVLEYLVESGVNIYTGAYTPETKVSDKVPEVKEKVYEVEYIDTFVSQLNSYSKIVSEYNKFNSGEDACIFKNNNLALVLNTIKNIMGIKVYEEQYAYVLDTLERCEKGIAECEEMLCRHKMAMWEQSSHTKVHQYDEQNWAIVDNKRLKEDKTEYVYNNLSSTLVIPLKMRLTNIKI